MIGRLASDYNFGISRLVPGGSASDRPKKFRFGNMRRTRAGEQNAAGRQMPASPLQNLVTLVSQKALRGGLNAGTNRR